MRIDIDDDIAALQAWSELHQGESGGDQILAGAVWMLSRVSGRDQAEIDQLVRSRRPAPAPPAVAPLPMAVVGDPVVVVPTIPDDVVGWYEGVGPIVRYGVEPLDADLSLPAGGGRAFAVDLESGGQVVSLGKSFAERAADDLVAGVPGVGAMDAAMLAEVEAELASAAGPPAKPVHEQ